MRNLICSPAARLSRWMSLAPSLSASRRVERTRRTTSLDSSRDALERKVLDRALGFAADRGFLAQRIERAQRLLVAREVGDQVAAVHQAPGERLAQPLGGPRLLLRGKRIVGRQQQAVVGMAQQRRSPSASTRRTAPCRTPGRAGAGPPCAAARSGKWPRGARRTRRARSARRSSSTSTTRRPAAAARAAAISVASIIARSIIAGSRRARRSACT